MSLHTTETCQIVVHVLEYEESRSTLHVAFVGFREDYFMEMDQVWMVYLFQ